MPFGCCAFRHRTQVYGMLTASAIKSAGGFVLGHNEFICGVFCRLTGLPVFFALRSPVATHKAPAQIGADPENTATSLRLNPAGYVPRALMVARSHSGLRSGWTRRGVVRVT
jgi:hypothetical protein